MNDGFGLRRVLTPRSISVLPLRQPVARPHGGVEIPFVSGFRKRPAPPQHNLPRVEHCRRSLAAIPPVEPGLNRAARELNLEFPIGHAYGARVELRVRRTVGVIEKRRDNVSGRFRIRRQPASEERVSGTDTSAPAEIRLAARRARVTM